LNTKTHCLTAATTTTTTTTTITTTSATSTTETTSTSINTSATTISTAATTTTTTTATATTTTINGSAAQFELWPLPRYCLLQILGFKNFDRMRKSGSSPTRLLAGGSQFFCEGLLTSSNSPFLWGQTLGLHLTPLCYTLCSHHAMHPEPSLGGSDFSFVGRAYLTTSYGAPILWDSYQPSTPT
jgi:hypothetical protein